MDPLAVTSTSDEELPPPARCEALCVVCSSLTAEIIVTVTIASRSAQTFEQRSGAERPSAPTHAARINEHWGVGGGVGPEVDC